MIVIHTSVYLIKWMNGGQGMVAHASKILAIQATGIRRVGVQGQSMKKVSKTPPQPKGWAVWHAPVTDPSYMEAYLGQ
jgi:hypothetical protein